MRQVSSHDRHLPSTPTADRPPSEEPSRPAALGHILVRGFRARLAAADLAARQSVRDGRLCELGSTSVQGSARWRARDGIVVAELDGELTLFDGEDTAYLLNGTAAEVWTLLRDPQDVTSLVTSLAPRYAVSPADIRDDVAAVLQELAEGGLVVPA